MTKSNITIKLKFLQQSALWNNKSVTIPMLYTLHDITDNVCELDCDTPRKSRKLNHALLPIVK